MSLSEEELTALFGVPTQPAAPHPELPGRRRPVSSHRKARIQRRQSSCPGKTRYPTGAAARSALDLIRTRAYQQRDHAPSGYYHCPLCNGFHLTSAPK